MAPPDGLCGGRPGVGASGAERFGPVRTGRVFILASRLPLGIVGPAALVAPFLGLPGLRSELGFADRAPAPRPLATGPGRGGGPLHARLRPGQRVRVFQAPRPRPTPTISSRLGHSGRQSRISAARSARATSTVGHPAARPDGGWDRPPDHGFGGGEDLADREAAAVPQVADERVGWYANRRDRWLRSP